jgi:hypothetical protein
LRHPERVPGTDVTAGRPLSASIELGHCPFRRLSTTQLLDDRFSIIARVAAEGVTNQRLGVLECRTRSSSKFWIQLRLALSQ